MEHKIRIVHSLLIKAKLEAILFTKTTNLWTKQIGHVSALTLHALNNLAYEGRSQAKLQVIDFYNTDDCTQCSGQN